MKCKKRANKHKQKMQLREIYSVINSNLRLISFYASSFIVLCVCDAHVDGKSVDDDLGVAMPLNNGNDYKVSMTPVVSFEDRQ